MSLLSSICDHLAVSMPGAAKKNGSDVKPLTRAIFNGQVIAEATATRNVDGYTYFSPDAVRWEYLKPSPTTTVCHWKGQARYYSVVVNGREETDAAWSYETPKPAAAGIQGHIGFWRGVKITTG